MSAALTVRIPIKDRRGQVVDEKEVATYAGLLAKAHDEGLKSIVTELVQVPPADNGDLAIVVATVETERGTYSGIGDAGPNNVNRRIVPHLIRMAETRAKARALRDATNIGVVSLEELGDDNYNQATDDQAPSNVRHLPRPNHGSRGQRRNNNTMSDAQRRLLFRLIVESGHEPEDAEYVLMNDAGVKDLADITKAQASALIDDWKQSGEVAHGS